MFHLVETLAASKFFLFLCGFGLTIVPFAGIMFIHRVEQGESFIITSEHGNAVMVPYKEVIQILNDSDVDEDVIRIHTDHEEAS